MNATKTMRIAALAGLGLLAAGAATAAGGHHGVDDAGILEARACEHETWFSRAPGRERLLHTGLNCGVGWVEVGVAGEHVRRPGNSDTAWSLEVKWAREIAEGFSVGVSVQPAWQAHLRPRHTGRVVNALATWSPRPDLALHFNLGRDFVRRADNLPRGGIGVDWTAAPGWTLTAERYLEEDTHALRAGVRWEAGRNWTLDLSRAQRVSGPAPSYWTIGITLGFGGGD